MKIFVETGPGFDECVTYRRIEVDLKAPGKSLRRGFEAGDGLDCSHSSVWPN